MTTFNDLIGAQANLGHQLLGGVTGIYRRGNVVVAESTTAIIDEDLLMPTADGMGVQNTIIGTFLKSDVPQVKSGDVFVVGVTTYIVNKKLQADDVATEAYLRKSNG